jgi:16S rRNA processing protein RimM
MMAKVRVARIGAAHGIRGEVRLWPYTQDPEAVTSYGPLETENGTQVIIEHLRPDKDHWVARLAGVNDREAAEVLTNLELFVPRERLPPIEEPDTFYHADLVGLVAVTAEGATIGTVAAVHNFGAGDIIEIAPSSGGAPLMLSFTEAAVPKVDLQAKRIVVVPPPITSIPPLKGEGRRRSRRGGVSSDE